MSSPIGDRDIHRSSKDLGRVLALTRLESREATEQWASRWRFALETCFPSRWPSLAARLGAGLRALLGDDLRFDEAWHCCNVGLLAAMGVAKVELRFTALQLLEDAIAPIEAAALRP